MLVLAVNLLLVQHFFAFLGRDRKIPSKNVSPTVVTTDTAAGKSGVIMAGACCFIAFGAAERARSAIAATATASGWSKYSLLYLFWPCNAPAGRGFDQRTPHRSTLLLSLQQAFSWQKAILFCIVLQSAGRHIFTHSFVSSFEHLVLYATALLMDWKKGTLSLTVGAHWLLSEASILPECSGNTRFELQIGNVPHGQEDLVYLYGP
jgi:hypothetical protein